MQKVKPITCQATSNLQVTIPDTSTRKVVLYFYPKDATPGCTTEGQDFKNKHQDFVALNTVIYGVSRDNLKSHEKFKSKQGFPFELIVDESEVLCNLFGVIRMKKLYGREYMGIVRSTFLIDNDGSVIKSWDNVKVAGHVDELLDVVKNL